MTRAAETQFGDKNKLDKAYGLRDSHKVADDVRMCDGDRAAFFDLALEQRDHASVAAENVSESYSYEFCAGSCFRCIGFTTFDLVM